jgi:hypothetical protein
MASEIVLTPDELVKVAHMAVDLISARRKRQETFVDSMVVFDTMAAPRRSKSSPTAYEPGSIASTAAPLGPAHAALNAPPFF